MVCVWMSKGRQKHSLLYYLLGAVWVAALVFLDQRIKTLVTEEFSGGKTSQLIPGILGLGYVENRGMAFGLLQNAQVLFVVLTVIILLFLILAYHAVPEKKRFFPLSAALVLITAGAVGNFIDRIRLGYVVDYLRLEFMEFPLFNLADCFLTWTAVATAVLLLFFYKNEDLKQIHL